MFRMLNLPVLVVSSLLLAKPASATLYKTSTSSRAAIRLGCGFFPDNPTRAPDDSLILYDGIRMGQNKEGNEGLSFKMKVIRSVSDLYKILEVDASLEASCMFGSAKAETSVKGEDEISSDTATLLIWAQQVFPVERCSNPRINPNLIAMEDGEIMSLIGPEVVLEQNRVAKLYLLFTYKNLSQREKSEIEGKLEASGSNGYVKAGFSRRICHF